MKYINKFFFTLASLSYYWTVFLIVQEKDLVKKIQQIINCNFFNKDYTCFISKIIYLALPVIISFITIKLASLFNKEFIEPEIISSEEINVNFIPTYLGYFFVALSFNNDIKISSVTLVFLILCFFVLVGSKHFYNPLFYISGFKLYKIKTKDGFESVIYSKKEIVTGISLKNWNIHRINKFTYIAYTK
ncbi:MAG: hypothetical protein SPJ89_10220 [Treponema sp.]|nr:hypothetical protein [Spirochaetia bacterium]MDD7459754.1 hypothetical protein [Spirochaetales bacterium]MDY5812342.1 hypothetical protein [Treponema sp.]